MATVPRRQPQLLPRLIPLRLLLQLREDGCHGAPGDDNNCYRDLNRYPNGSGNGGEDAMIMATVPRQRPRLLPRLIPLRLLLRLREDGCHGAPGNDSNCYCDLNRYRNGSGNGDCDDYDNDSNGDG
jgi:hypothetical protein